MDAGTGLSRMLSFVISFLLLISFARDASEMFVLVIKEAPALVDGEDTYIFPKRFIKPFFVMKSLSRTAITTNPFGSEN